MRCMPVLFAALLLVPGCCGWFQPRYPILERPQRPRLENISSEELVKMSREEQQKIERNFEKLIDYSRKLEISVDEYNVYAREQNKLLDELGDAD